MANSPVNEWFCRQHYGGFFDVSPQDFERWGTAVTMIVAADGFSEQEQAVWSELGKGFGAPPEMITAMSSMDVSKLHLADVLSGFKDGTPARALLYSAIVIASADGFSDAERKFAEKTADVLGVDRHVLDSIISLYEAEVALNNVKGSLLLARNGHS